MLQQQPAQLGHQGRGHVLARGQEVRDLAEDPWPALGGAADHHGIGARVGEHVARLLGAGDVAIGHHGHAHRRLDGSDGVVLGKALVTLLARAAVHGEHLYAHLLEAAGQHHGVPVRVAPAGAHLQRDGHAVRGAGLYHSLGNLHGQGLVLHQGRAGPFVADLLGRAAHVDVDDLGATVQVVARGLGHHLGVRARDLHRDGAGLAFMVGAARGLEAVPQVLARCHHLADRVARAQGLAQLAERPIRHPGHGGDEQAIGQGMGAYGQGWGGHRKSRRKRARRAQNGRQQRTKIVPAQIFSRAKTGPSRRPSSENKTVRSFHGVGTKVRTWPGTACSP